MVPLQPGCELENQQIPPLIPRRPDHILNDLPITISNFTDMGKQKMTTAQENIGGKDGDADTKRILHRDIERQRRQEMSNLYANLRSLLPLEYIKVRTCFTSSSISNGRVFGPACSIYKGKRAISDHMHEAVNYIKCLQMNINQLRARRDGLIKMSNSISSSSKNNGNGADSCFSFPTCTNISVSRSAEGLEILVGSSPKDEVFPLSRVLKVLLGEGLNVVCCVSTIVGEMRVHTIRTEVSNEQPSIDVLALRQKLTNMIEANHSNS